MLDKKNEVIKNLFLYYLKYLLYNWLLPLCWYVLLLLVLHKLTRQVLLRTKLKYKIKYSKKS